MATTNAKVLVLRYARHDRHNRPVLKPEGEEHLPRLGSVLLQPKYVARFLPEVDLSKARVTLVVEQPDGQEGSR